MAKKGTRFTASPAWRILRWTPVAAMLLAIASLLVAISLGSMCKVLAWYLLQFIPPLLGLLFLIATVLYVIIRRCLSRAVVITGMVSLLSICSKSARMMRIRVGHCQ